MKSLTQKDTHYIYRRFLDKAAKHLEKLEYAAAVDELEYAARWAYTFNFDFSTAAIDKLISAVRKHYMHDFAVEAAESNNIVMLDSFAWDNRGLTQQYVRAFCSLGYNLLFINTDSDERMQGDIRKELEEYSNARSIYLDKKRGYKENLEIIKKAIIDFKPSKMFLHFAPLDFLPIMVADACEGVEIYNINLTDHAFWPGVSFIDYNIEFRQYGMTLSMEKRGFTKEQLINLPYYPIEPCETEFEGFPELPDDAVKIFSGGSFYKMFGADDMYFKMLQSLLDISDKVHILIAGSGDGNVMNSKLEKIKGRERIYLLGNRHDISEVFRHCDIYLSTYPFFGGLMTQYAVLYEKPLLILENKAHPVLEVVNHFGSGARMFNDLPSLTEYATRLIEAPTFRLAEGKRGKAAMMNKERFAAILHDYMQGKECEHFSHWEKDEIDCHNIISEALERENNYGDSCKKNLWKRYGWGMFILFPRCFMLTSSIGLYCCRVKTKERLYSVASKIKRILVRRNG